MTTRRDPRIEVIASSTIFRGRIFDLVEESVRLPSGLRQDLVFVDHPGAVAIAAQEDSGELLVVRQYRHSIGAWLLEIPAGRVERGEDALDAARRELEEETGHRAARWERLGEFHPAPGFCSEKIVIFRARGLERVRDDDPRAAKKDDDEELELLRMSPAAILAGATTDAKTWIAASMLR